VVAARRRFGIGEVAWEPVFTSLMISALAQTLTSPTNRKIKAVSARTGGRVTPSCWAFSYDFFIINTSGGKLSRARPEE